MAEQEANLPKSDNESAEDAAGLTLRSSTRSSSGARTATLTESDRPYRSAAETSSTGDGETAAASAFGTTTTVVVEVKSSGGDPQAATRSPTTPARTSRDIRPT
jgi:hypothetical protein